MARVVALLALVFVASSSHAQAIIQPGQVRFAAPPWPDPRTTRVATAADSMPKTIAEAEAQGRRHPHRVFQGAPPTAFTTAGIVGTADRRCVDVNDVRLARSGEFVAGNFAGLGARRVLAPIKVFWYPLHEARPNAPTALVVRTVRIDGPSDGYVFASPPVTSLAPVHDLMLPSGPMIGATGKWMLVATAAENWGCFILKIK